MTHRAISRQAQRAGAQDWFRRKDFPICNSMWWWYCCFGFCRLRGWYALPLLRCRRGQSRRAHALPKELVGHRRIGVREVFHMMVLHCLLRVVSVGSQSETDPRTFRGCSAEQAWVVPSCAIGVPQHPLTPVLKIAENASE